jgi:hypothetical protein
MTRGSMPPPALVEKSYWIIPTNRRGSFWKLSRLSICISPKPLPVKTTAMPSPVEPPAFRLSSVESSHRRGGAQIRRAFY